MKKNIFAVAVSIEANRSDENIETMRLSVEKTAKEYGCIFIHGNNTSILIEGDKLEDFDPYFLLDDLKSLLNTLSIHLFEIDFQDDENIYRNFVDVNQHIGQLLTFKLLEYLDFDIESLDYKAIALSDYSRFYSDC